MHAYRTHNTWFISLTPGEEIITSLKNFCTQKNIILASLTGIGACDVVELALYDPKQKKYFNRTLTGNFEIAPLTGNITTMNGEPYLHCHITLGDESFTSYSGHLVSAIISAACEIVLQVYEGEVERIKNEVIGLNTLNIKEYHDTN